MPLDPQQLAQQITDPSTPATVNPNMLAQVMRYRNANLRPEPSFDPMKSQILSGMINGVKAPYEAWQGNPVVDGVPLYSPQEWEQKQMHGAMDTAGLAMGGGAALGRAPVGSVGMIPVETAKTLKTKVSLPEHPEFLSAVKNTPNAELVDGGLKLRLARSQQPEQGLQDSVRGGVFYLPEGAAQMKHYSKGGTAGNHYGGSEKITGETLVSNPLFVKGGTGGKAPEAAYDSLLGKGAYQKMRTDALHWSGGPRDIREEAVTKFLQTYAPEMSDKAFYILQNSTKGNQLAYALQEAAVSSAVRKAGHDAVLGYSVSRNTKQPFISEIFDVREINYPDKFGTQTDIWDIFKKTGS